MFAALLPLLGPAITKLLDLIPDPEARRKAEAEAYAMLSSQQHEIAKAVLEINKAEAQHSSIFVAGWRPFIGWVCGMAFAWHFLGEPMTTYALAFAGKAVQLPPSLDMGELLAVLGGLLGIGGLRSWEKAKGVAR